MTKSLFQGTNRIRETAQKVLNHKREGAAEDLTNDDDQGKVEAQTEEGDIGSDLFVVGTVSHNPLRLRGGGEESESDEENTKEPPEKKTRTDESLLLDPDVSDELLNSPTPTKAQGAKRRSNSCDGRVEGGKERDLGGIFFHSTPVRPGAGGLSVSFKDDMDLLNDKITDLLRKKTKKRDGIVSKKGQYG